MSKDIFDKVGSSGRCGCETVSREVLPQVEIPEKWTQEPPYLDWVLAPAASNIGGCGTSLPPCFAITTGVRLRSHTSLCTPVYKKGSKHAKQWEPEPQSNSLQRTAYQSPKGCTPLLMT